MTRKQQITELINSGIFGILTSIVLFVVGYFWIQATQLLVDIEGFGLGRIVIFLPYVGYAVMIVAVLVLIYGIGRLSSGLMSRSRYVEKSQQVKKNQDDAVLVERSSFEKQRIKGVIFDLDGTLLDTIEDLTDALNVVIVNYGYPKKTIEEVSTVVGNGMRNLVKGVLPMDTSDEEIDTILEEYLAAYALNYQNKTRPYAGIIELVETLNSKGYLLAVISNKKQEYTSRLIASIFPDIPFVDVIGDTDGQPRKPDPTTTLMVIDAMMLAKTEVIFVGDSQQDIMTARHANIQSIAVTWGFRTQELLMVEEPNYFAHTPSDIFEIISEINQNTVA